MDWHTAMSDWISQVNGEIVNPQRPEEQAGLGGFTDWRVPTLAELESLLDCPPAPCLNPILGADIGQCDFWSSSTVAGSNGIVAISFEFDFGVPIGDAKRDPFCVRAVRNLFGRAEAK